MGKEQDIQNLIQQFQKQQTIMQPNIADHHTGIDNQGDVMSSSPLPPGSLQPAKGPDPVAVGNICPQCNMLHPPLKPGEKCPNAKIVIKSDSKEGRDIDVNKYLVVLKNILVSQIEQKEIKDVQKLFQNITIEITKFLEGYNK